jgi:hypothetical protein
MVVWIVTIFIVVFPAFHLRMNTDVMNRLWQSPFGSAYCSSRWYKSFFKLTIPSYIAIALPLSWVAATSIRLAFGLPISAWTFFALMVSPFPWWYFT